MDIIYYKDPIGNFGDDLNSWLWDEVAPFIVDLKNDYSLLGVGSIINKDIIKDNNVVVFGSGVAYGVPPKANDIKISCVRGKLSAKILGIDESYAIADSAILIKEIPKYKPIDEKNKNGVIFIPHHATFNKYNLSEISEQAGVELINPCGDSKEIIKKIQCAKLVITEAMHGAIIADTVRTRWVPVVLSKDISTFKWLDWMSMFNLEYNPIYIGLPNIYQNKLNLIKIKHNLSHFKYNHHLGDENEILNHSKKTISYKISRLMLQLTYPFIKNKSRDKEVIEIIKKAIKEDGYLSDDLIFDKNLNLLKAKLEELRVI